MSYIELVNFTIVMVMTLGLAAFVFGEKVHVSSIPLLMVLGLLFGPVLGMIERQEAHHIFNYARIFGLVIILFAEGHNLQWKLIKRHFATIGILDTAGLLTTALIGGFFFSFLFHQPFAIGFLFGAIISATDPATLIPLFKQNKVEENVRTVILTESIFNDPLGIVLTILAISLVIPQASEAHLVESIAHVTGLFPAAAIFFLYQIVSSVIIGSIFGIGGYWLIRWLKPGFLPHVFGLTIAFGGFLTGEWVQTSGYLVATVTGIVFGNHELIFKNKKQNITFKKFLNKELSFNESLSDMAGIFIFILIGASIDLSIFGDTLVKGTILALIIIFVARPIAVLGILPLRRWSFREYLFISLEGPRGVVPSALASLPLTLGLMYKQQSLIDAGEIILAATMITVLISVFAGTLFVKPMSKMLQKK